MKLLETTHSYAFLDIGPIAPKHSLVIPKHHAAKLHELPDEYLADLLPVAKKVALASGAEQYNVLQNNGRMAHQLVDHVHFHVIPKPDEQQGLGVGWPATQPEKEELQKVGSLASLHAHSADGWPRPDLRRAQGEAVMLV
ncbi:hypothetical protein L7F22_051282 [Adiantum nelumboides]|nr:hypothetical protein [Adiantum nelumboides]